MKLADIAQETGLHESTISRTLRSKYLQCTWGVYPLNYFLTSVASTDKNSGEEQTPEYIKKQIREIIDGEDKKSPSVMMPSAENWRNDRSGSRAERSTNTVRRWGSRIKADGKTGNFRGGADIGRKK